MFMQVIILAVSYYLQLAKITSVANWIASETDLLEREALISERTECN